MKIAGSRALVTGANRGLGQEIARQLVANGAEVWAAARDVSTISLDGVHPIRIDLHDAESIEEAAHIASGVNLVVNNAGVNTRSNLLDAPLDDIRAELETNFVGPLAMMRSFAPVLVANRPSTLVNILSVMSWYSIPRSGAYGVSKAAAWSATNSIRLDLAPQGVRTLAVHVAYMRTDMTRGFDDATKSEPSDVATMILDSIEQGHLELYADHMTREVIANLPSGAEAVYGLAAQPSETEARRDGEETWS